MLSISVDPKIPQGLLVGEWEEWPIWWTALNDLHYFSPRYGHSTTGPAGFVCDGASMVPDVGVAWIWHDFLYYWARWDDGSRVTKLQADNVFRDIMRLEGRWLRSRVRYIGVRRGANRAWRGHRESHGRKHNDDLMRENLSRIKMLHDAGALGDTPILDLDPIPLTV